MAKWKNIPCPAGCAAGLIKVARARQVTDADGKKTMTTEWVDELCGACDGSGYIHVPGD